jgi:hypothetical protein
MVNNVNDPKPTPPPLPGTLPPNMPPQSGGAGGNVYGDRSIIKPNPRLRPPQHRVRREADRKHLPQALLGEGERVLRVADQHVGPHPVRCDREPCREQPTRGMPQRLEFIARMRQAEMLLPKHRDRARRMHGIGNAAQAKRWRVKRDRMMRDSVRRKDASSGHPAASAGRAPAGSLDPMSSTNNP